MVQNVNPTFVKTPNNSVTQLTTGTNSGATVTCYTGGASGTKISSIVITASTSSTQDLRLILVSSAGTNGYFNAVSVSSLSGLVSSLSPVNGLANCPLPLDSDGNPFLFLNSSAQSVGVQLTTNSSQWTTGSLMAITITAGDF